MTPLWAPLTSGLLSHALPQLDERQRSREQSITYASQTHSQSDPISAPSSPSQSEPPSHVRTSLLLLPLELKRKICVLAKTQDEEFFGMKTDRRLCREWDNVQTVVTRPDGGDSWDGQELECSLSHIRSVPRHCCTFLIRCMFSCKDREKSILSVADGRKS